jgi:hypothetical protein
MPVQALGDHAPSASVEDDRGSAAMTMTRRYDRCRMVVHNSWQLGGYGSVERHYVVLEGEDRGLVAVGEAELGQDAGYTALDRLLG